MDDGASHVHEQIRQHSVTICAMEERLNKVMKRNKDYQAEITQLKGALQGRYMTSVYVNLVTPKSYKTDCLSSYY